MAAVGLALAAGGILLVVRHLDTVQAERSATRHVRFVADSILRQELRPSDFALPVTGQRRSELDQLFRPILVDGVLAATLFARDGTVTYSNDHALIGSVTGDAGLVEETLGGTIRSDVATISLGNGAEGPRKVLRAFVPIPLGRADEAGAMALYQDYAPIAEAANAAFVPVAGILELALIALYVMLFPILRRVTSRIRQQMEDIEHLALHDDLTGLPNRTLFRDRIEQALLSARRDGHQLAVMLIDLDRFKEINDALGHQSGDLLLKDLGARLRAVLRANESFARLGGDEFAVLIPRLAETSVSEVAERIRSALEEPFELQGLPLAVEASIGISLYPQSAEDVDVLIQRADVAMYFAKEARSGYAVYSPEHDPNDPTRLALVGELRRAIEQRELVLFFQPKVDLRTGEIRGAEALLRWQHPDRGLLPPGEFVPLAERTGLVKPLSRYVLEAALAQWHAWQAAGFDLHVAVNIAVPNLLDLGFSDDVAGLVRLWRVEPGGLELEITESTLMTDPFRVREVLERLSEVGVLLAIDDFGTGYSSLAYLKRLPVNEIKIDKSFVRNMASDPNDATIVRSTIDLARNLGLRVVAEGVETEEVWTALAGLGCDLAQGYYIGRPMPASELTARLRSQAAAVDGGMPAAWRSARRALAGRASS